MWYSAMKQNLPERKYSSISIELVWYKYAKVNIYSFDCSLNDMKFFCQRLPSIGILENGNKRQKRIFIKIGKSNRARLSHNLAKSCNILMFLYHYLCNCLPSRLQWMFPSIIHYKLTAIFFWKVNYLASCLK
jgi:hypothetical protein